MLKSAPWLGLGLLLSVFLSACYQPPYNQFEPEHPIVNTTGVGAGVGTVVGAAAGATLLGTGIGAAGGALVGMSQSSQANLVKTMQKNAIQVVEYGDRITLVVPTDRYFLFRRATLYEGRYPGLVAMVNFIKQYPNAYITIASFTDDVGSKRVNRQFSEARAHTMASFLYANGIRVQQLNPQGLGPLFPIGDNHLVHGAAYNRRLEIQWQKGCGFQGKNAECQFVALTK